MNFGDGVCARVQNSQLFVVCTTMMTSWMIHLCKATNEEVLVLTILGDSRISQTGRGQGGLGGLKSNRLNVKNT